MRFAIPCFLIGALCVSVLWCAYIQWDERRLSNLYDLNYRIREYRRMKHGETHQGGNQHWWNDG
jgi:hypothetical protein